MRGAVSFLRRDDGLTRWGTSATLPTTVALGPPVFFEQDRRYLAEIEYIVLLSLFVDVYMAINSLFTL